MRKKGTFKIIQDRGGKGWESKKLTWHRGKKSRPHLKLHRLHWSIAVGIFQVNAATQGFCTPSPPTFLKESRQNKNKLTDAPCARLPCLSEGYLSL